MGIRVIGDTNGNSQRFRVAASNDSGTDGKPALGGDADTGELDIDEPNNGDEPISGVAPGFIDTSTIDAGTSSSGSSSTGTRVKRKYTKRGSSGNGNGRGSRADTTQTTDDIAAFLASAHLLTAKLLKMPQFVINEDESKKLAAATIRVTQLYTDGLGTEEQRAWINLAMVAGSIYVPKIFAGKQSNVVTMPQPAQVTQQRQAPQREAVPGWMQ